MNWINAQRYCRERYTDLASMRNESERNKMKMLVKKSAWIGLYRVAWKWSDGQIMDVTSFQKWSTGQPKKIKHYCVTTTHGGWNARPCSDKYAFVCRVRKQVRVKVMLKTSDSSVDLEDMQDAILQQFSQRLKDHGRSEHVNLKWMKQPDGKTFQLKESEEKKKKRSDK
ncbi:lithostathine-1-alpha-like isoform X1 [Amphiprion ocellaris]|uniref:lithostathine-1-alpha-like isoform X1 n=1 Tax=Amphiprion ocellaris TaxID=80972 RepID=UPI002410CA68|nr:lithostathine-1-alpha-like isoform X1 [Amphiprion ocellaris]